MQLVTLPPYLRKPSLLLLLLVSVFVLICITPFVRDTFAPSLDLPQVKHLLPVRRDERNRGQETHSETRRGFPSKRSSQYKNTTLEEASPDEGFANSTNPIPTTPHPAATATTERFVKGKSHRVKLDEFTRKNTNDVKTGDSSLAVAGLVCRHTSECERCDFSDQKKPECQETGYRETVECIPDDVSDDSRSNNFTDPRPVVLVKFRSCTLGRSQETKRFLTFQLVNAVCAIASTFAVIYRRRELNAHQYEMLNRRINSV